MVNVSPPSPPLVGDGIPNRHSGMGNKPIRRVVVHSAVMPCEPGRARQLGSMNQTSTTGSWHYAVDPKETVQCSWDSVVCWHAPPNSNSIGIEMADHPGPRPAGVPMSRLAELRKVWRWAGPNHRAMLDRTAYLTARLLLAYELPVEYVDSAGLKAGRRGWTTHAQVSGAFHQSSHWDPGWWPRRRFGRLVRKHATTIRKEAAK